MVFNFTSFFFHHTKPVIHFNVLDRQTFQHSSSNIRKCTFTNSSVLHTTKIRTLNRNKNHIVIRRVNRSYPCLPRDDRLHSLWSP